MKTGSGVSCPTFPADYPTSTVLPCPLLRRSVLLSLTTECGSSCPRVPTCLELTDVVATTSLFLLSPHKALESRGGSLPRLEIPHHSACALADIPSHGFSSQRTLWCADPVLSPPLSWQKGPGQPPAGLRDPTPAPPSRQENRVEAHPLLTNVPHLPTHAA